jgi:hypothetical protein
MRVPMRRTVGATALLLALASAHCDHSAPATMRCDRAEDGTFDHEASAVHSPFPSQATW